MATFKKLPKKPKKPKLASASLQTLKNYTIKVKDWDKKCNDVKKYNKDLKSARLMVSRM